MLYVPKNQESYFIHQHRAVNRFLDESINLLPSSGPILELICYLINRPPSISVAFFKYMIGTGTDALRKMSTHIGEMELSENRNSRILNAPSSQRLELHLVNERHMIF